MRDVLGFGDRSSYCSIRRELGMYGSVSTISQATGVNCLSDEYTASWYGTSSLIGRLRPSSNCIPSGLGRWSSLSRQDEERRMTAVHELAVNRLWTQAFVSAWLGQSQAS
jgi:hypothetical protein